MRLKLHNKKALPTELVRHCFYCQSKDSDGRHRVWCPWPVDDDEVWTVNSEHAKCAAVLDRIQQLHEEACFDRDLARSMLADAVKVMHRVNVMRGCVHSFRACGASTTHTKPATCPFCSRYDLEARGLRTKH